MDQIRGLSVCSKALGYDEAPAMRDLVTIDMSSKIRIAPHLREPNGVNYKCNDHVMEKMDDRPMRKCNTGVYLTPREYNQSRPLRSGADMTPVQPSRGYFTDAERVYQKPMRAEFGQHRPQTHNDNTVLPQPQVRARDPLARQFDSLLLMMPQHLSRDREMPNSLKQRVVLDPGVRKPSMPHVGTNPHKEQIVRENRIRGSQPESGHTPVLVQPHALSRPTHLQSTMQQTNAAFGSYHGMDRGNDMKRRREGAQKGEAAPYLHTPTRMRTIERPQVFHPMPETRKKGKSISQPVR